MTTKIDGSLIKSGTVPLAAVSNQNTTNSSKLLQVQSDGTLGLISNPGVAFKNRIINGDFRVDQRYSGTAQTPATTGYLMDRWTAIMTNASKLTFTPLGPTFGLYAGGYQISVASAYSPTASEYFCLFQKIEGYNIADLQWGTANAKACTLSFWVQSNITGAYSVCFGNDPGTTYFQASYTIAAINTPQLVTITIPGPTTGTWKVGNATGLYVTFVLGAGTTYQGSFTGAWGASNYLNTGSSVNFVTNSGGVLTISGVQFEVGAQASAFEQLPYDVQLSRCLRYFEYFGAVVFKTQPSATLSVASNDIIVYEPWRVIKRGVPTMYCYGISATFNSTDLGKAFNQSSANYAANSAAGVATTYTEFYVKNNTGGALSITNSFYSTYVFGDAELY